MTTKALKSVMILGGGLAGIRAALTLSQQGFEVTVLEKRPFLGGRAYSFKENKTGSTVDNGQHLLMGAYAETLKLIQELGSQDKVTRQETLKVPYQSPQGQATLQAAKLPHPLGLAWGFLSFRGLKLKDKWKIAQLMRWIQKKSAQFPAQAQDKISVKKMLQESGQSKRAIKVFWEPFTLATINENLEKASSHRLIQVLKASLLKSSQDSQLIFANQGLSQVFGKPAEALFQKQGISLHYQEQAQAIAQKNQHWEIKNSQGKSFIADTLLLAIPPTALTRLLKNSHWPETKLLENLKNFKSSPILSINLWYEKLPEIKKFSALLESPLQWLFNKAKVLEQNGKAYLSLLISADSALSNKSKESLIKLATSELEKFFPELKKTKVYHSQVIKEWEATYSGSSHLVEKIPSLKLAEGLFLAGDWLHPKFPGTLEGAVAMGKKTAEMILKEKELPSKHT